MKAIRFYYHWIKYGRAYWVALKELERLNRTVGNLIAWTADRPMVADEVAEWLASLDTVNPEVDGDGA